MTDDESKPGKELRQFRPENFIRRLQAEGFVQWDPITWIHPRDIPIFLAKRKINRWRRRRAMMMAQRAEAESRAQPDPEYLSRVY